MAKNNAFHLVEERKLAHLRKANRTIYPIQELKEKLSLPKLPRKMVCLDISTIQGTDTVASAVFFENGKPKKKFYRHFIIKSLDTQNDYAALQETLTRYLKECDENYSLHLCSYEEAYKYNVPEIMIKSKVNPGFSIAFDK